MSVQSLHIGFVLIAVSLLSANGCSSPPWRKQQAVSQQAKDAYLKQAVERVQYDDVETDPSGFQSKSVPESNYAANPPVSRSTNSGSASCCH